jgi:hypothetical protein
MQNSVLDKLIWVLIFGGMVSFTLGLSLLQGDGTLGWVVTGAGAAAVVVGAGLIYVRSRRS